MDGGAGGHPDRNVSWLLQPQRQCTCSCKRQHVGGLSTLQDPACQVMIPRCRREPSSAALAAWCTTCTRSLAAVSVMVSITNLISCRRASDQPAGVACDSVPPLMLRPLVLPLSLSACCHALPVSSCGALSKRLLLAVFAGPSPAIPYRPASASSWDLTLFLGVWRRAIPRCEQAAAKAAAEDRRCGSGGEGKH